MVVVVVVVVGGGGQHMAVHLSSESSRVFDSLHKGACLRLQQIGRGVEARDVGYWVVWGGHKGIQ